MGDTPKKAKAKDRPAWLTGAESPPRVTPGGAPRRRTEQATAGAATRTGPGAGPLVTGGDDPSREHSEEPAGELAREYLDRVDRRPDGNDPQGKGSRSDESRRPTILG